MRFGAHIRTSIPGYVLATGIAITMLTAVAVGFFAEPNGDDFCRAKLLPLIRAVEGWHQAASPWSYAKESWTFWTGRWLAMWIETSVLTRTDLTTGYSAILFGGWALLVAGCIGFVRLLTTASLSWARTAALGIGLFALFWSTTPGLGEGHYWFTGMVENVLPISANIAVVAVTARASARLDGAWILGAAMLAFVTPGLHELHSVGLVGVLALGYYFSRNRGRWASFPWLLSLLFAGGGLALVILASGNARRAEFWPTPDLMIAARLTAIKIWQLVPEWVLSVPLLSATAWVATTSDLGVLRLRWAREHLTGRRIYIVPALTIAVVVTGFLGPSYAMSAPAPGRTLSGVYLVFLLGWFTTVLLIRQRFDSPPNGPAGASPLHSLSAIALGLSLAFLGHVPTATWELRTSMPRWHDSLQARYEVLKAARPGSGAVAVTPINVAPSLFFTLDVEEDITAWRNQCVAGYFGLQAVQLRPATGQTTEEK